MWSAATDRDQGILVTVGPQGHPQLSNVLYAADQEADGGYIIEISSTVHRQKTRNLRRNDWAAMHIEFGHFWAWAVFEGAAEVSEPPESITDDRVAALLDFYRRLYDVIDEEALAREMVDDGRVIVRLRVRRSYGVLTHPRDVAVGTDTTERLGRRTWTR
jgi:PPOX class probable F420-dependent enzyme